MNKSKKFSIALLIGATSISLLMAYGSQLGNTSTLCRTTALGSVMPWDSACFYNTIFEKGSSPEDVYYEKYRLDHFSERGGLSPAVLWYRSNFHRIYKDVFDVDEESIEKYHWDYQSSQPHEVKELVVYMDHVSKQFGPEAGQSALDKYCDKYLAHTRYKKVSYANIFNVLESKSVEHDNQHCASYLE